MSSTASRLASNGHSTPGHSPVRGHGGAHPVAPKPRRGWGWLLLVLMAVAAAALLLTMTSRSAHGLTGRDLAQACRSLLKGTAPPAGAGGVSLRVAVANGHAMVVAEGVPPRACVGAAWDLVKDGTVAINGLVPMRVSGAKLAELCNQADTATMSWTPQGR
ncbi:hypothetical protein GALL_87440 [mine drainage metagenome]|uniref:Uncharacterized protein n=1 Tax=mine drainage metagenome TaxID=410659 RepID=A0A1J5SKY4_9ZZZZ